MLLLLILLSLFADLSKQQHSISWIERSDHVDSSCISRSMSERDNIILHSRISMGSLNDLMDRAQYEIKKQGLTYETLCYVDLTKCKGYTPSNCYCDKKREPYVIDVTVNMTAQTSISEAEIKGTIYNYNNQIYSDRVKLASVYGVSKSDIEIYINGKLMNNEQCEATSGEKTVAVLLKTSEKSYLPLTLSAEDNNTGKLLKNETNILKFVTDVESQVTMKLNYEISTVPKSRHSLVCKIKAGNKCHDVQRRFVVFVGLCIITLIVTLIIIGCIKFHYNLKPYKYQKLRKKKEENKSETLELNKKEDVACNVRNTSSASSVAVSIMPTDIISLKIESDILNLLEKAKKKALEGRTTQYKDSFRKVIQFQLNTMVKLKINKTSNRRPKHWPGETIPYPYYSSRGCDTDRLGVGRIVSVKLMNRDDKETSLVWRSQYPKFNKTEWIEIIVYTSRHVVFDDIEVKHTTCSFLINDFDNDDAESKIATNSPIIKVSGNIKCNFQGEIVNMANFTEDWIFLTFTTDDVSCFNDLSSNLYDYNEKRKIILQSTGLLKDLQDMGFVVEFPMKQTEQIKQMKNDLKQMYNYLKCYLQQSKNNFKPKDNHLKQTDDYLNQINDHLKQVQDRLEQTLDYPKQNKDNLNLIKPSEDHLNLSKQTEDHLNLIKPTEDHLKRSQKYFKRTHMYLKRKDDRLIQSDKDHTNIYLEHTTKYLKHTKNFLKRTTYTAKQTDFSDLLKLYLEPIERKKLSDTLNTYFPNQKTAIYFELQNDYYMKREQTEIKEEQDKKFNSFPIVLKFTEKLIF